MFEDSLVESVGRIRTRSRYFAIGSFAIQASLLAALAMYPFLHPATLPKQALMMLLTAPSPPSSPANLPSRAAPDSIHAQPMQLSDLLTAPSRIPQHVSMMSDFGPAPAGVDSGLGKTGSGPNSDLFGALGPPSSAPVKPEPPKGPLHVSSGVAAGQLLMPIQPVYPAVARQARIQGTVVVQALISTSGTIEQLRVLSGPVMLQGAATEAIQRARYRPFMLNGQPVAVETTISVVFTLSGRN